MPACGRSASIAKITLISPSSGDFDAHTAEMPWVVICMSPYSLCPCNWNAVRLVTMPWIACRSVRCPAPGAHSWRAPLERIGEQIELAIGGGIVGAVRRAHHAQRDGKTGDHAATDQSKPFHVSSPSAPRLLTRVPDRAFAILAKLEIKPRLRPETRTRVQGHHANGFARKQWSPSRTVTRPALPTQYRSQRLSQGSRPDPLYGKDRQTGPCRRPGR